MIKLPLLAGDAEPATASRALEVGWLLDAEKASFIWDAPRRLTRTEPAPEHAKAVAYCPAVLDHEARLFEVPCPIDVNLGFRFDKDGRPAVVNLDGDKTAIRPNALNDMLAIVNKREWRHPDRPIIQLITPYIFIADEPVYISQLPPYASYVMNGWPGVLVGGRFPAHLWPRQMMWALEWYDIKKPLSLRRGEPWFYVRFEANDPTRPTRLVEAEWTPELREFQKGVSAVANFMNRTFSLFKIAEARRPKTLLTRKRRSSARESASD
jgi:hypothetical protein